MIRVRAIVTGERDTSPYFQVFEYSDESYERIFVPSVNIIKEKLAMGLRINLNECLSLFCNYVVSQLRAQNPIELIEGRARKILSPQNVMVGVPESLRGVDFHVKLNEASHYVISFKEPIKIMRYELS
ncbi:MAG: urease subunit gamma [Nitrososphaeraceae archaeon]